MTEQQTAISTWLQAIGRAQDTEISLNDEGQTCLQCDGDTLVFIEVPAEADFVFFYAPMVRLPDDVGMQNALLKKALGLNLFSLETGGASLSFDPRMQMVVLSFGIEHAVLDEEIFGAALGGFIELAVSMKERFQSGRDLAAGTSESARAHAAESQGGLQGLSTPQPMLRL